MSGSGATGAASGIAVATVVAKVATWDFANRASPFFIQRRKNLTQNESEVANEATPCIFFTYLKAASENEPFHWNTPASRL